MPPTSKQMDNDSTPKETVSGIPPIDIQIADLVSENAKLKIQVTDIEEDKTLKAKQIIDLQTHFGLLTASYFDLKRKLEQELGDKFKSSVDESRMYLPSQAPPVVPPPV